MTYLAWDENYSVHHTRMDEQHAKIFNQINLLWEAAFKDRRREVKEMIMQGLIQTIQQHFCDEETLLEAHQYHDLQLHRSLHFGLSRQLVEFDNKSNKANYHKAPEMMEFLLKRVVIEHILREDRQYVPLFRAAPTRLGKRPVSGSSAGSLPAR